MKLDFVDKFHLKIENTKEAHSKISEFLSKYPKGTPLLRLGFLTPKTDLIVETIIYILKDFPKNIEQGDKVKIDGKELEIEFKIDTYYKELRAYKFKNSL